MKKLSRILAIILSLIFVFQLTASAYTSKEMTDSVSGWLMKNITVEQAGTDIDSYLDQTVFALARSGNKSYAKAYGSYINKAVSEHFDELYLNDFARISLAAMSVGLNPKSVGGHNLMQAIADTDLSNEAYTGSIAYALIALNSAYNYAPSTQAQLRDLLLKAQRADGGFNAYLVADPGSYWTLDGETDSTGIALQALAVFAGDAKTDSAISAAVAFLKAQQMADGSFGSWGSASAESTAQVMAGLCAAGIDPLCADFCKDDKTMITALSSFINPDGGARCWDGSSNIMTGYQLLFGLNAYDRFVSGEAGLFEMSAPAAICRSIVSSFIGRNIPQLAQPLCNLVKTFYAVTGIETYR